MFNPTNGVKQGSVASPVFICVYIDVIFELIEKAGIGCRAGNQFVGIFGYADDLVLLSASRTDLQLMLSHCTILLISMDMLINAKKCKSLVFRPQYCKLEVQFVKCLAINDVAVPWLIRVNHLGNIVSFDLIVMYMIFKINVAVFLVLLFCFLVFLNSAMAALSRLRMTHRANVFNTYCISLYSCQQWNLSHNNITQLETSWNIAVRRMYNFNHQTHRNLLPALAHLLNFYDILLFRFYTFLK